MGRGIAALLVAALTLLAGAPAGAQDPSSCRLASDPADPRRCEDHDDPVAAPAPTAAAEDAAAPAGGAGTGAGRLADGQDDTMVRWLWAVSVPLIGGIIFLATRSVAGTRNGRRRR